MKKIIALLLITMGMNAQDLPFRQIQKAAGNNSLVITTGTNHALTYTTSIPYSLISGTPSVQSPLNGTGFVVATGTVISYDNSTYLTTASAAGLYVPYTGATTNVLLGTNYLTTTGGVGIGATPTSANLINISSVQNAGSMIYVQNTNAGSAAGAGVKFLNNSNDAIIIQASTGNTNYTPNALNFYQTTGAGFDFKNTSQSILRIGAGTANTASVYVTGTFSTAASATIHNAFVGQWSASTAYAAFHHTAVAAATQYALVQHSSGLTYLNSSTQTNLSVGSNVVIELNDRQMIAKPVLSTSGSNINFVFTSPASTGLTASTNIPYFKVIGNTKTWSTGALATQYFNHFSDNTIAFAGASTASDAYNTFIESVVAGTNATITRKYSLGTTDNVAFGVGNASSQLYLGVAPNGSTNWALSPAAGAGSMYLNAPTSGFIVLSIGTANRMQINNSSMTFGAANPGSGSTVYYNFLVPPTTNLTAGANVSMFKVTGNNISFATGAQSNQYFNYFSANTIAYTGASTTSTLANLAVDYNQGGTNATVTHNSAIHIPSLTVTNSTNSHGILIHLASGATNNYGFYVKGSSDNYNVIESMLSNGGATIDFKNGTTNWRVGNQIGSNTQDFEIKLQSGGASNTTKLIFSHTNDNVGIGTGATIAVASAKLEIGGTTQGFLPPRLTTTQKNAISSPAEGLIIYDVTLHKICVYTGSAWETVTSL